MISDFDVRQSLGPLRQIFWGALLWLLDIQINGFDILNDVLATVIIAVGVTRLARVDVSDKYRAAMGFVKVTAYVSVVSAAVQMVNGLPQALVVPLTIISLAQLAATITFCIAMQWFCLEAGLTKSATSWRLTTILFAWLFAAPLGVVFGAILVSQATDARWSFRLGASVLFVLAVLLVPIIHFFISTSRMKREVAGGMTYRGHGFEVLPPRDSR